MNEFFCLLFLFIVCAVRVLSREWRSLNAVAQGAIVLHFIHLTISIYCLLWRCQDRLFVTSRIVRARRVPVRNTVIMQIYALIDEQCYNFVEK